MCNFLYAWGTKNIKMAIKITYLSRIVFCYILIVSYILQTEYFVTTRKIPKIIEHLRPFWKWMRLYQMREETFYIPSPIVHRMSIKVETAAVRNILQCSLWILINISSNQNIKWLNSNLQVNSARPSSNTMGIFRSSCVPYTQTHIKANKFLLII